MENEKIPPQLREKLEKEFPGDEILIGVSSDVTHEGFYGTEWLIVTNRELQVYSLDDGKIELLFKTSIGAIKNIEAVNLVGRGVVEVELSDHRHRIVSYSDAKNFEFGQAVDDIQDLKDGKSIKDKKRTHHKRICEKCNRPIPHDMNVCPRCTDKKKTFTRIMSFSRPYFGLLFLVFLTMLVAICFELVTPYIAKLFIDVVFQENPTPGTSAYRVAELLGSVLPHQESATGAYPYRWLLGWLVLVSVVSLVATQIFSGLRERLSGYLGHRTVYDVRAATYEKMQDLSLSFFDKHQTGALLARVNQDTRELQRLLVDFFPITLESFFMVIGVGFFLFYLSWQLTLFVFIPIFLEILFVKNIFKRIRIYFHRFFHRRSRLSALVSDSLSGIRVVKAFGQESTELDKFDKKSADYRDAGIELRNKWSFYHPVSHVIIASSSSIVWGIGGLLIFRGNMSLGDIVAYIGYVALFNRPIFMLMRFVELITNALSAAERVFDIIDSEPEIQDAPDAVSMPDIKGELKFENVTFGYNRFDPVIKNLTVTIAQNEMIGLVGKSGAGKSTLINLICRLYDVDKGSISLDGVDLRKIKYSDLRRQIGVVLQDTFLFNGTIYDNIAYARPDATKEEVVEASIAANAHEFIIQKPDGYDTDVGERGNRLSGGEKQRVAIARAILRNPRILILDEATASVDTHTEQKVQKALDNLMHNRTTIAIAHRLSTLRNCDRILVINEGELVEIGTHAELLEKKGLFYDLVTMQKELSEIMAIN